MGFLYVAMGGAVGACLRYAMSLWIGGGLARITRDPIKFFISFGAIGAIHLRGR